MAFRAFLKIDSIPGESIDTGHEGWIDVIEFSHELEQPPRKQIGQKSGAAAYSDHKQFHFTKLMDKSSPKLNLACASGRNVGTVTIHLSKAGNETSKVNYMVYTLEEVCVARVSPAGKTHLAQVDSSKGETLSDLPMESVDLSYLKIKWEFTETDVANNPMGAHVAYWNLDTNTGG